MESLQSRSWRNADRLMMKLLVAHLAFALVLAPWHGTWVIAVLVGGVATATAAVVMRRASGTLLAPLTMATALMTYSALFIWQSGGMIEFHFHIFAGLAFLLVYRDWRVPVWGAAIIAVHHLIFNFLQESGIAPSAVFRSEQGLVIVRTHAGFVVFETAVLVYISLMLARETRESQRLLILAERIGAGDLRVGAGGTGQLGVATEAMIHGITQVAELVAAARRSVETLAASSQEIAATADESGRVVSEMAGSVGTISDGAQRQVGAMESTRRSAGEMVAMVSASAVNAEETARAALDAQALAESGMRAAVDASTAMRAVRDSSQRAKSVMADLSEKTAQIGGITGSITSIASQTNLLALNAAIEAARAGEHGRGFAVVADEVRSLAEAAREAAGRIETLLTEVHESTTEAVASVEEGALQIQGGADTVEQAREAFVRIGSSIEDVTTRVGEIAAAISQLNSETRRVHGEVDEIARMAEGFSTASDEVAASSRQTASSSDAIAASTRAAAGTVEELADLLRRFEL